jgi:hypothetical protein
VDHLGLGHAQAAGLAAREQQPGHRAGADNAAETIRRHGQTVLSRGRRGWTGVDRDLADSAGSAPRQTSGHSRT